MTVIGMNGFGDADCLKPELRPIPSPTENEVLIKVAAAGLNRPDIMQRLGKYPPPAGASDILGLEVSGSIVAIGNKVENFEVDDAVCALVNGGGYAEYCLAQADHCLPVPTMLTVEQSAALPETFFTVWSNVFEQGQLKTGERILIHGGTSGIGVTAIQLAKAMGAEVFVTAGNDEKCQFCESLGVLLAINYQQQDFVVRIKHFTNGEGVNLVLDMVGGAYLAKNMACLATSGRLVQIGLQLGATAEINLWSIMKKRLTIMGSTLRARDIDYKSKIARDLYQHVWPVIEAGQIKPIIDSSFPLAAAAEAHRHMESSRHKGKILLTV